MTMPNIRGRLDGVHAEGIIYGWVDGLENTNSRGKIYVFADEQWLGVAEPRYRAPDGTVGRAGFGWIPSLESLAALRPGCQLHAYFDEWRMHELDNSPVELDQAAIDGLLNKARVLRYRRLASRLDGIMPDSSIYGWAFDPQVPDEALAIHLYVGAHAIGVVQAGQFRGDLRQARIGDGKHGFFSPISPEWPLPLLAELLAGAPIHAYFDEERKHELADSPFQPRQEDLVKVLPRLGLRQVIRVDLYGKDLAERQPLVRVSPPVHAAAYVTMVKDEEDIISANLAWHYAMGFRKFVIIENNSTDQTRARIAAFQERFADAVVLVLSDPITAYLQSEFTTSAARLACSIWPEVRWIFPVDADEFLCLRRPLEALLADVPDAVDALAFPKSFYTFTAQDSGVEEDGLSFFERIPYRTPITAESAKVAVRSNPNTVIHQGNHEVSIAGRDSVVYMGGYSLGGHYREFRIRSMEHLRKKIVNGGKAVAAAEAMEQKHVGGHHWRDWYAAYGKDGDLFLKQLFQEYSKPREDMVLDPLPYSPSTGFPNLYPATPHE